MNKLKNKAAVVTGTSKEIGASIAEYFTAEGTDKVVKSITDNGGTAILV